MPASPVPPLPPFILSASAFVCERLLQEADGVVSAIRIIDIFFVPSERPPDVPENALPFLQGWGCVMLKFIPGHVEQHTFEMKLINTVGELSSIGDPSKPTNLGASKGLEEFPGGILLNAPLNIAVKRFGTCYLCAFVDEREVARTPFSIVPRPGVATAFSVPPKEVIG